ncbi:4861_t:CDS:2 [Gigaspora rosea]|nr:4861_t:CDS:2 [Gigaspora rosea]
MGTIKPEIPIASGVIDLMGNEDIFTKLLSLETKQILSRHSFCNNEFPNRICVTFGVILTYSKWPLKQAWSEQTSKSSQSRKNQMVSINLGKKPDLQVLLKLDMKANKLVLVEISRLFPEQDKKVLDWKKLARLIQYELGKIPILGIQVVKEFLKGSLRLRAMVEEIVGMSLSIKDEINLLPTCEERTLSTSMMSTTYPPPRNS